MTVSFRVAGTATGNVAPDSVIPTVGAGVTATDLNVLAVVAKPYDTVISTPAGWTKIGEWTSGSVASALNAGSVKLAVYYKIGCNPGDAVAVTQSGANSMVAVINSWQTSLGGWDLSGLGTGVDPTFDLSYNTTCSAAINVTANDRLQAICGMDCGTGTVSGAAFVTTGATQTDHQGRTNANIVTGDRTRVYWRDVGFTTTGTPTPVFNATQTANTDGVTLFLRLRDFSQVNILINDNIGAQDLMNPQILSSTWQIDDPTNITDVVQAIVSVPPIYNINITDLVNTTDNNQAAKFTQSLLVGSQSDTLTTKYTALGYTGSVHDMSRQYYLAQLGLSEPQALSTADLERRYMDSIGNTGQSLSDGFALLGDEPFPASDI